MLRRFKDYIAEHDLIPPGAHVVAGVSGGADSVVLLYLLHKAGVPVTVCHVNYRLRLPAADEEAAFVSDLCARLHLECRIRRIEDFDDVQRAGASVQIAARDIRYRYFAETAEDVSARCVAVGHHLDDQAETVLLKLFRGSGPEGLAGMAPSRPVSAGSDVSVIRPLLWARRREIEAYARRHGLSWREDASNLSSAYRRNAIRRRLMPVITELYGEGVVNVIDRNASILRSWYTEVFEPELGAWRQRAVSDESGGGVRVSLDALREMPGVIRSRLLLDLLHGTGAAPEGSAAVSDEVLQLIDAQPGARKVFEAVEIWRERDELLLRPRPERTPESPVSLGPGDEAKMAGQTVSLRLTEPPPSPADTPPTVEYLDAALLAFPLKLRRWMQGDAFQPLGSTYTVKLSDFLTDAKIPPSRKQDVLVLESAGEICCLPGIRIDHRFRLTDQTTSALRVDVRKA